MTDSDLWRVGEVAVAPGSPQDRRVPRPRRARPVLLLLLALITAGLLPAGAAQAQGRAPGPARSHAAVQLTPLKYSEFTIPGTTQIRVVGEVGNTSTVSVGSAQVTIVAQATSPMTFVATTSVAILQPGEVSGFAQEFAMPPGYTGSTVTAASGTATAPDNHLFTTTITTADTNQVSGTVVNNDVATAQLARVDVTFFDGSGKPVDVGGVYPGSGGQSTLGPGMSAPFTVTRRAGAPAASTVATLAEAQSGPVRAQGGECPATRALSSESTTLAAGGYHPLPAPARVLDTRLASLSSYAGHALCGVATPSSLELTVAGVGGVPAQGVSAVFLTVTATNATVGYASAYPAGAPAPTASNLNFSPGKTLAQLVEVPVGLGGRITLIAATPHADLIVDVSGYVDSDGSGGALTPVTPQRLADTRTGSGSPKLGGAFGPAESRSLAVRGPSGGSPDVPGTAQAVIINLTAAATTDGTFLTVYGGAPRPGTSNLNARRGEVVSDRVISPVDSSGQITIYNNLGRTDVVVDLVGYVAATPTAGSGQLHSLVPHRVADTRPGSRQPYAGRTLGPGGQVDVLVAGQGGVVAGAKAVLAVLTGTDTSLNGYALAYPPSSSKLPAVSDVNWNAGRTVPNLVLVPLDASGSVRLAIGPGKADLILDVVGYLD